MDECKNFSPAYLAVAGFSQALATLKEIPDKAAVTPNAERPIGNALVAGWLIAC
jgi:hypothetical protein